MIILDTDLLSETMKVMPDPGVVAWLRNRDADDGFVTAVSLAELRFGVERLPVGQRREMFGAQIDLVFGRNFAGRVLPFDERAAYEFGEIAALAEGKVVDSVLDMQIAAIARVYGATVATRNIKHFKLFEVPLINPWDA